MPLQSVLDLRNGAFGITVMGMGTNSTGEVLRLVRSPDALLRIQFYFRFIFHILWRMQIRMLGSEEELR